MIGFIENILDETIACGKGGFDAIVAGVREIVAVDQISIAAPLARFVERFQPGEQEEPVAAVRGAIEQEIVVRALLEHENAGRILPAVVNSVRVAADAPIELVARDGVPARAIERQPPAAVKRAVVVIDGAFTRSRPANAVLASMRDIIPQRESRAPVERDGR